MIPTTRVGSNGCSITCIAYAIGLMFSLALVWIYTEESSIFARIEHVIENTTDTLTTRSPTRPTHPPINEPSTPVNTSGKGCNPSRFRERPGRLPRRSPPIQYIHIPKAGGTTIQDELSSFARREGVPVRLHDGGGPLWDSDPSSFHRGRGLFLGHRGLGFSPSFKQRLVADTVKPMYIVSVREPMSRLISLFDYIMRTNVQQFEMFHAAWKGLSFDEVIERYDKAIKSGINPAGQAIDVEKEYVALYRLLHQQVDYLCGYDCVFLPYDDYTGKDFATVPAAILTEEQKFERALNNLKAIDCVGVIEKFNDILPQIKRNVDWIPEYFQRFPKENKRVGESSTASDKTKEILRRHMVHEYDIYNVASKIAEEKLKCN